MCVCVCVRACVRVCSHLSLLAYLLLLFASCCRLREEEDRQISAAVYSLDPVTTEEDMYQTHDKARERELTVTPRYSLEQRRVGGREWSMHPTGKQWVSYFSETQCGKDDVDTVRRVRRNLGPDNSPVERQAAVRMLGELPSCA